MDKQRDEPKSQCRIILRPPEKEGGLDEFLSVLVEMLDDYLRRREVVSSEQHPQSVEKQKAA